MENVLLNANIGYLDDEESFRNDLKDFFEAKNYKITLFTSIEEVNQQAHQGSQWILICDLRLHEIQPDAKGDKILKQIRSTNKDIFLVLYTAYHTDISKFEQLLLDSDNIKIYSKGDNEEFILNLNRDYSRFLKEKSERKIPEKRVYATVKNHIIYYLRSIENPNLKIPITGHKMSLSAKSLIQEIENDKSEVGLDYIDDWLNTYSVISSIKMQNEN